MEWPLPSWVVVKLLFWTLDSDIFLQSFSWRKKGSYSTTIIEKESQLAKVYNRYYLDKWTGDERLLSILKSQFGQTELSKSYLYMHISQIDLDAINIFNHKEEYLLYQDQYVRRAYFYIFTSQNLPPNKLSRKDFTKIYFNFCILWPDHNSTKQQRKALSDITTDQLTNSRTTIYDSTSTNKNDSSSESCSILIYPEIKKRMQQVISKFGAYFNCCLSKNLFGCKVNETVYDCLSQHIDLLDDVLKITHQFYQ